MRKQTATKVHCGSYHVIVEHGGILYGCGQTKSSELSSGLLRIEKPYIPKKNGEEESPDGKTQVSNLVEIRVPEYVGKIRKLVNRHASHNLVLTRSGKLFGFGDNWCAALFDSSYPESSGVDAVPDWTLIPKFKKKNVTDIFIVDAGSFVIVNYRDIYVGGNDENYRLGGSNGDVIKADFLRENERIEVILGGLDHTLLLSTFRRVFGVGMNNLGQLGIIQDDIEGEKKTIKKFTRIKYFEEHNITVKQVSCGEAHSIFLSVKSHVYTCGDGTNYILGFDDEQCRYTPTKVKSLEKFAVQKVESGFNTTFFLLENGKIMVCGDNADCKLCLPESVDYTGGNSTDPRVLTWLKSDLRFANVFSMHCSVILVSKDGFVWAGGENKHGECCASTFDTPLVLTKTDFRVRFGSKILLRYIENYWDCCVICVSE